MLRVTLLALDSETQRFSVQDWKKVTISIFEGEALKWRITMLGVERLPNSDVIQDHLSQKLKDLKLLLDYRKYMVCERRDKMQ